MEAPGGSSLTCRHRRAALASPNAWGRSGQSCCSAAWRFIAEEEYEWFVCKRKKGLATLR